MELNAKEKITKAKIKLYDEAPFLSYIINHLQYTEDNNLKSKTMAVDNFGRCYYDKKFVEKLSEEELKGVLAHEALHCALEHLNRLNGRDMEVWNVATDIVINNMIINQGIRLPNIGIIPYNNMFEIAAHKIKLINIDKKMAEMIYNELQEKLPPKQKIKIMVSLKGFDEHMHGDKGKGKGDNGTEIKIDEQDWKRILAEANTFARQKGKGSSQLDRIVEAALTKKINWKVLLSRFMTNDISSDYSYARPSKRSFGAGAYLPYMMKENMNVTIAIDTSGSIRQAELSEFMGQVYAITKSFHNIKLTLLFHDDKIVKEEHFNNMNLRQILRVKPCGGGGTSHQEIMDYAKKKSVNVLVCFTDGYSDINEVKNQFKKTIFVLTTKNCEEPKYGRCVYYERGDKI